MKSKEIKELQNKLFDRLEPYFVLKGFSLDRKEWNISSNNHKLSLYVNTTYFDGYTLRPILSVIYKELFDTIQLLVKKDDFQIFNNGYFYTNQKLANVFGIHDFDECQENGFNKFRENFVIDVINDNTEQVADRIIELMDTFGLKTIDATSNLGSLYEFYKKIMHLFLNEYEKNPLKKATEYQLILDINAYLTLVYVGIEKTDYEIFEIISRWHKIQNNRPYYVDPVNKIISHFKLLQ